MPTMAMHSGWWSYLEPRGAYLKPNSNVTPQAVINQVKRRSADLNQSSIEPHAQISWLDEFLFLIS